MTKISVIIATFNASRTLSRALDSVLNQSNKNIECIVVDGLSTDNTINLLKGYNDDHLRYISEKDNGIFDALNKGIRMATGEWIYVLGSDDEVLPGIFDKFLSTSSIEDYDIIYGDTIDRYPDGHLRHPKSKDYHMIRYNMFCCHQGMFMKRKMMLELGLFNLQYRLEADVDLTLRAFLKGYKFLQVNYPVAYFDMSGSTGEKAIRFDKELYSILKNNHSTKFPYIVVALIFLKDVIKRKLLKL